MRTLLLISLLLFPASAGRAQTPPAPDTGRRVTVNLKKGEAVSGRFLRADAEAVYLDVDDERVTIDLDEVAGLVFPQAEPESPAARAFRALKSLAEAGVGTDNRAFGNRLLEVKALVDDQLPLVPEGELREALGDTLKAFEIVSEIWDQAARSAPAEEAGKMTTDAISTTWSGARKRLEQAEALLKKRP